MGVVGKGEGLAVRVDGRSGSIRGRFGGGQRQREGYVKRGSIGPDRRRRGLVVVCGVHGGVVVSTMLGKMRIGVWQQRRRVHFGHRAWQGCRKWASSAAAGLVQGTLLAGVLSPGPCKIGHGTIAWFGVRWCQDEQEAAAGRGEPSGVGRTNGVAARVTGTMYNVQRRTGHRNRPSKD